MHITFNPPLAQSTCIPAGSRNPLKLHFTATLHQQVDYRDFTTRGLKVQLWSDLIDPAWGAADFVPIPEHDPESSSLVTRDYTASGRFSLSLTLPASSGSRQFSFTYRVLHPSGQLEWLGEYGQNGTLLLEDGFYNLDNSWVPSGSGTSMKHEAGLQSSSEIAKVDSSYEVVGDSTEVLILVPNQASVVRTPILVFATTSVGSISVDANGTVSVSGDPSVEFTSCESIEELQDALVSAHTSFLPTADSIILGSATRAYILPTNLSPSPQEVRVAVRDLAAIAPTALPLCLYSEQHQFAKFFAADESVSFIVDPTGGSLTLVPMSRHSEAWHAGIVSPHYSSPTDTLPTPPPSPRLRPLTHRRPSNSPDPSFLDLSAPVAVPEFTPPKAVMRPRPNLLILLGYTILALGAWFVRLLFCLPRRPKALPAPPRSSRIPDEQTPLLSDSEPPTVLVVEPVLRANVPAGKISILFYGNETPFHVPIQLEGNNVDRNIHEMPGSFYLVEFSSKSGGMLIVG